MAAKEHGGARKGAGRKPKRLKATSDDALEFLRLVMQEAEADPALRVRAAIEVARIEKAARPGTVGKKSLATNAAKEAADGKFAPSAPPKLVVNNDGR